jgi:iron complex transport system substrate-binding protein
MRPLRFLSLLALLLVALIAGCGDDDEGSEREASGAAPAAAGEAAFPATVEHKYGTTTIERAPERVVVVGLREQDALLALGIVPVATTEWYGEHPGAIFPWATDELGDAPLPEVLSSTDGIQVEKVAAQRPDLILAVYSGLTQKEYDTLSKLAPVVAQPKGQVDWGSSWQDEITMVGAAVGKPDEAERLRAEAEAAIAAAAEANPDFEGQTAAVATPYQGIYVYGPEDARSRFLVDLGFTFPPELEDVGGEDFGGQLSDERVDLLDVGALLWFADAEGAAELAKDSVYGKLDVHEEGRDIFLEEQGTLYEATSFISVLSIPTLIEELVPKLAAAADGDTTTKTSD